MSRSAIEKKRRRKGLAGYQLLAQTEPRRPAGQVMDEQLDGQPGCGIGVPWASWRIPAWADSHNDPWANHGGYQ